MKKCTYKNYEDLPLMLNAETVGNALGISRSSAYELMRKEGFPALWIEGRVVVTRDKFIEWVEQNTGK
ncbi:MAG: helix-turn-helix domain-containing protein [Clostridia bacterium]|nr:helix-turn-helix domain-containing protein [Clostridia bacterium]